VGGSPADGPDAAEASSLAGSGSGAREAPGKAPDPGRGERRDASGSLRHEDAVASGGRPRAAGLDVASLAAAGRSLGKGAKGSDKRRSGQKLDRFAAELERLTVTRLESQRHWLERRSARARAEQQSAAEDRAARARAARAEREARAERAARAAAAVPTLPSPPRVGLPRGGLPRSDGRAEEGRKRACGGAGGGAGGGNSQIRTPPRTPPRALRAPGGDAGALAAETERGGRGGGACEFGNFAPPHAPQIPNCDGKDPALVAEVGAAAARLAAAREERAALKAETEGLLARQRAARDRAERADERRRKAAEARAREGAAHRESVRDLAVHIKAAAFVGPPGEGAGPATEASGGSILGVAPARDASRADGRERRRRGQRGRKKRRGKR
jgi:hypothetical protein